MRNLIICCLFVFMSVSGLLALPIDISESLNISGKVSSFERSYYEEGNKFREKEQYSFGLDGSIISRTKYDNTGAVIYRAMYTYISDGSYEIDEEASNGSFFKNSKYNKYKKLESVRYHGWGEQSGGSTYTYDSNGNLIASITSSGQGVGSKEQYTLNTKGQIIEAVCTHGFFGTQDSKPLQRKIYIYNENGKCIEEIIYNNQSQLEKTLYKYDNAGNCVEVKNFDSNNAIVKTIETRYKYIKGPLVQEKEIYINGVFESKHHYRYDEKGNPISGSNFLMNNGNLTLYSSWATSYIYEDKEERYKSMLKSVFSLDVPLSSIKMNEAGYVLYTQKRYKEALPYFKAAIELDTKYEFANYNYACTLALLNGQGEKVDIPEIVFHLRRSLKLDPNKKYHMRSDTDLDSVRNIFEISIMMK